MALKPCRECGQDVSAKARTCPQCGVQSPAKKDAALGGPLLLLFILMSPVMIIGIAMVVIPDGEPTRAEPPQALEPWEKMAVIQTGSPYPPADLETRFRTALEELGRRCPDEPTRIGDFLVAGHGQLTTRGNPTTLLDLTEAVSALLTTDAPPQMESCSEPVALMVVSLIGG